MRACGIIGVVGTTFNTDPNHKLTDAADRQLLGLAYEVGALIARESQAVLTGGHHKRPEVSVKYQALLGAINMASETQPARVIGVLPKSISDVLKVDEVTVEPLRDDLLRGAYIHTQLSSKERNLLTGEAADALVALRGAKGTAEEVDAALGAGRPVVFLKSWNVLSAHLSRSPQAPCEAETPAQAVAKALSAIDVHSSSPRFEGALPDTFAAYRDSTKYARLKAEYEQSLRGLCS